VTPAGAAGWTQNGLTLPKSEDIRLRSGGSIPILYEDRAVLAVDKPAGWLLAPASWRQTGRNLQAALEAGIAAGDFWAASRNLSYLRFVHRLDAETSGVLLLAKSRGALRVYGQLFQSRQMEKVYLAVARGTPADAEWTCRLKLRPDPQAAGRMRVAARSGKTAETHFRLLSVRQDSECGPVALLAARPLTGRTHQIRVHLAASGHPVVGDRLYGLKGLDRDLPASRQVIRLSSYQLVRLPRAQAARRQGGGRQTMQRAQDEPDGASDAEFPLALRAIRLRYLDPFEHQSVRIQAPVAAWLEAWGWPPEAASSA
jgi:RluA family pseudouridine synthase